ncbi:MCE family protein [Nocardioides sp. Bht2]|uniref:MCE family protein n=1 Tax=Nocardioides sp. Bht2 TaxID=3392297 RepID=UPI0039B5D3E7
MNWLRTWSRRRLVIVAVVVALVGVGATRFADDTGNVSVTVYFPTTEGLHEGDDVKVLGVAVGKVSKVQAEDDRVKVILEVDADQPVPVDASAVIVAPSLVSGRFVQLEPAWTGGKKMADGAVIAQKNTAVPVSFDDVKRQLTDLAEVLGPQATQGDAVGKAPLAEAVRSIERSLKQGNSTQLRASLDALHEAANDLSDDRSDLFRTISNLNSFTRNLAVNDAAVQGFATELGDVARVLSTNRSQLSGALVDLSSALTVTDGYLSKHRKGIRSVTRNADQLAALLADQSNEIAGILHIAPTALIDLHHIIEDSAITGRATLSNLDSVAQLICGAVLGAGGTTATCVAALQPLLSVADQALKPGKNDGGTAQPGAKPGSSPAPQEPVDLIQQLLGGVLGPLLPLNKAAQ